MTVAPSKACQRIAICVCTHDRPAALSALLASLREIELIGLDPAAVEVVVVDNRPNPGTRDLCEAARAGLPIGLHYAEEPQPGLTYARNRAVAVAVERGADFVAFIDDDDQPQPDWLLRLLEQQAATGADLVFGSWVLDPHMPDWARACPDPAADQPE